MKNVSCSSIKGILIGAVVCLLLGGPVSQGDFNFGEPFPVPNVGGDNYYDMNVRIAAHGLALYMTSFRPGGYGERDLWVAQRPTENDEWGTPVNLGPQVNSTGCDAGASISADNLALYFYSQDRPGGYGGYDLWVSTRETTEDDWGEAVNLGPTFNTAAQDLAPNISADNLSLYFTCDRPGGSGDRDIWVSMRETPQHDWGTPVNLGSTVNWSYWDTQPDISADGRTLFFSRLRDYSSNDCDIWVTRRATIHDDWGDPLRLPSPVNSLYNERCTSISADGSTLYFVSNRPHMYDGHHIWQVSVEPVVDLSGDGIVDSADMCIMVDHWLTDDPLCDIGPMPWGDGVVDVQDLIVLAEHLFEEFPPVEVEEIHVDENDTSSQIELEQGQILVVTLESNPTTGYRWEQLESQESVLRKMGETEYRPSDAGAPPLVGAGGWEIFRFKATSAGQTTLRIIYRRSWEEGIEPLKTFSIQVVVR